MMMTKTTTTMKMMTMMMTIEAIGGGHRLVGRGQQPATGHERIPIKPSTRRRNVDQILDGMMERKMKKRVRMD